MKRNAIPLLSVIVLLLAVLACTYPSQNQADQQALATTVAQTVVAQISASPAPALVTATLPGVSVFPTIPPQNTYTPAPSAPSATPTYIPCNLGAFVSDVSIPDGTNLLVGATFTKTWRLRNIGSCTWTSSYQLVFDNGDSMNGPATQALTGTVAPGDTADISVNLVAPNNPGTYKGFWHLRDGAGSTFGLGNGSFWVEIVAVAPTPSATVTTVPTAPAGQVNAPVVPAETGSVRSNGSIFNFVNVGDNETNLAQQGFLSFDISGIPSGATIQDVKTNFSDYSNTLGNPFALGCLRLYPQNYVSVQASDFVSGAVTGAVARWCNTGEMSAAASQPDLKSAIQSAVGGTRVRFRLEFNEIVTNNNSAADMLRFGNGLILVITYSVP